MPGNQTLYSETVDFLYGLRKHGIKFGLDNTLKLMHVLGEPQKSFRSIHIAGTNGKGSTAFMIASVLEKSGYTVGLFTSPHLVSFTERIRINGTQIPEAEVIRRTSSIRGLIEKADINPTFFEFVTAMAFSYFSREGVDWAVVETGMGGRLDATNVIFPDVTVITNVGFDHREYLGTTLVDIAGEKAGTIKPSVPVVTAAADPHALNVLKEKARQTGSALHVYGKDFSSELVSMDEGHSIFDYCSSPPLGGSVNRYTAHGRYRLTVPGRHQMYNASLAIRTVEILSSQGTPIPDGAIREGLSDLNIEGRFEFLSYKPPVIVDSAHNPDAVQTLCATFRELFPHKRLIVIIGMMKDKDQKGILEAILNMSDTLILTKPAGDRAAAPEHLYDVIESLSKNNVARGTVRAETDESHRQSSVLITQNVAEAVDLARTLCHDDDIILVTGSFYTAGEVKQCLGHPGGTMSHLRE